MQLTTNSIILDSFFHLVKKTLKKIFPSKFNKKFYNKKFIMMQGNFILLVKKPGLNLNQHLLKDQ